MDIKQQILKELVGLEESVTRLRATALHAGKQTDLEVAILTEQNKTLREKNARAKELVGKSITVLKGMK